MTFPLRRVLAPLLVGSIACTALLFGWAAAQDLRVPHPADMLRAWPFMLLFQALGLALLVPVDRAVLKWSHPKLLRPLLVAPVGSAIAVLLLLPISIAPPAFPAMLLPMACGAVSALIWLAFDREQRPG